MDRIEFAQKLAENVDAFNILYEDISDDGDGVLRLTGLGEELADFIESEIDKAREEGYKDGVKDEMKGKVFEKVEIETEVKFKDLKDVIEGKEDAGEFLSKLKNNK